MLFWLHLIAPAFAQGDFDDPEDDIDIEEADEGAPSKPVPPPPDEADLPADETGDEADDSLDAFKDDEESSEDLLEGEDEAISGDTEKVYRRYLAALSDLAPDEELAGWEEYLAKYPDSAYRTRIEVRMEELTEKMYSTTLPEGEEGPIDALRQELTFSHPLLLENINPRTRLQAAFEFGLPTYVNLLLDYEHQFARTFSAHGALRRRYLGYNVEAGVKWSPVKSVRTGTLVTLLADVRFNTIPAYPALRPQLAIGKRVGNADIQLQGGVDLAYRTELSAFQPTVVGGLNFFYRVNDGIGWFLESSTYMKPVEAALPAFEGGLFRFNVVSFGFKFYPNKKGNQEVAAGATVPYMQQWWQFHYGSVMGQFNWYPDN